MGLFDFLKKDKKNSEKEDNISSLKQGGFESAFTEIQKDMISICLEYVEDKADKVYIYGAIEDGEYCPGFFFEVDGVIYNRAKLPSGYDVSVERQGKCLEILCDDLLKLESVCLENEKEVPTEMKIIYDIKNHKVDAKYRYDLVFTNTNKDPDEIAEEWFEEVKAAKNQE